MPGLFSLVLKRCIHISREYITYKSLLSDLYYRLYREEALIVIVSLQEMNEFVCVKYLAVYNFGLQL